MQDRIVGMIARNNSACQVPGRGQRAMNAQEGPRCVHRVARERGDEQDAGLVSRSQECHQRGVWLGRSGRHACFPEGRASFPREETVAEESPGRQRCTAALCGLKSRDLAALRVNVFDQDAPPQNMALGIQTTPSWYFEERRAQGQLGKR